MERLESKEHTVRRLSREEYYHPREAGVFKEFKPQRIFYLAAYGSQRGEDIPGETLRANVVALFNLLSGVYEENINCPVVIVGSSSEYGKKAIAMSEDLSLEPDTFYAATKGMATLMARAFSVQTKIPTIIVRPFSVYGPGERDTRFIPTVIRSCLKNEPMTLDPGANHDWVYLDDVVEGIIHFANFPNSKGEIFNLGTGIQLPNQKIVDIVEELTDKKANIKERLKLRPDDSNNWQADTIKSKVYGWKATTSIVKGLEKTIKYYKAKYGI